MTALGDWRATIGAAMTNEVGGRFKSNRIGLVLAFAEPFILLMMLMILRVFFRDKLAVYGESAVVFLSSGILPFFLYVRLSARGRRTRYDASQRLPRVSNTELVVASVVADSAIYLTSMMIWFSILAFVDSSQAVPVSPLTCIVSLFFLGCLGIGVGLVSSAIAQRVPFWNYFFGFANRFLIFVSGVFFIADYMMLYRREWLELNPLAQGIIWFRVGLYGPSYPHILLDTGYMMLWSCVALFLGIVAHRATLRL
jgi:capsular polysaccharide transport system permease protein